MQQNKSAEPARVTSLDALMILQAATVVVDSL